MNKDTSHAEMDQRIFERPDGYYWADPETGKEYGPFSTLEAVTTDMEYNADSDFEPGETLEEAESELGIADWLDPDTGAPAESFTHLEDH